MCTLQNRNFNERKRRRRKRILPRLCSNRHILISFCFLLIFCSIFSFSGCSQKTDIPKPEQVTQTETKTKEYINKDLDFVTQIPTDWEESNSENEIIWTETNTGTMLSVKSTDYTPVINNINQDNIMQNIGVNGELLNYQKSSGNVIKLRISKSNTESKVVIDDIIIQWTFSKIYTLKYETEEKYEVHYNDYFSAFTNSFTTYNKADTIEEGYSAYYNTSTNIYIEYPINWLIDYFDTGFTVTSQDTQTTITVDNAVAINNFSEITEVQYLELMRRSVPNISLTSYQNTGGRIIAELYYQDETATYYVYNTMLDFTDFTLNITYFANSNYAEQDLPYLEKMLNSITG